MTWAVEDRVNELKTPIARMPQLNRECEKRTHVCI
jgi:hypothetical protein